MLKQLLPSLITLRSSSVTADELSDKDDSDQIKTVFQNDQGKKTIDVYWIADDGGGHKEGLNLTKQANTEHVMKCRLGCPPSSLSV